MLFDKQMNLVPICDPDTLAGVILELGRIIPAFSFSKAKVSKVSTIKNPTPDYREWGIRQ
jgi:hypothetical protein